MTVACGGAAVASYLLVAGATSTTDFASQLGLYITTIPLGQSWLALTVLAAVLTVLCLAVRGPWTTAGVTVMAACGPIMLAAQGHGAVAGHTIQLSADIVHLLAFSIWVGPFVVLALIVRTLDPGALVAAVRRFSSIALVAYGAIAVSGVVTVVVQVGSWADLATGYGMIALVKADVLVILGGFGWFQRRVLIDGIRPTLGRGTPTAAGTDGNEQRGSIRFWRFAAAELVFLGVAAGLGDALSRTAPPAPSTIGANPSPAELLTGLPLPPAPTLMNYLTQWRVDVLWLVGAAFAVAWYVAGVVRLRRRGDRWPWLRTVLWIVGCLLLVWVTNGGLNVYQEVLFSAHMVAHMSLTMVVPAFLVLGAPVTLLARAVHPRRDGSMGIREWVLRIVHTPVFRALAHPLAAAIIFAGSLYVFYYTPVFGWATETHLGHEWMLLHFFISGYLFMQAMDGIDPGPKRWAPPFRLILLLGTMAFHAFFGLSIIMGNGLLLAGWYGAMGWGTDALADQRLGGALAWSIGELPTVALAIGVAVLWTRADERETRRRDRHADRTGEAELQAYNARLAALAAADTSTSATELDDNRAVAVDEGVATDLKGNVGDERTDRAVKQ